jgi:hypothetical protein
MDKKSMVGRKSAAPSAALPPAERVQIAADLRHVLQWEAHRMGAVSAGTLRRAIARLEADPAFAAEEVA